MNVFTFLSFLLPTVSAVKINAAQALQLEYDKYSPADIKIASELVEDVDDAIQLLKHSEEVWHAPMLQIKHAYDFARASNKLSGIAPPTPEQQFKQVKYILMNEKLQKAKIPANHQTSANIKGKMVAFVPYALELFDDDLDQCLAYLFLWHRTDLYGDFGVEENYELLKDPAALKSVLLRIELEKAGIDQASVSVDDIDSMLQTFDGDVDKALVFFYLKNNFAKMNKEEGHGGHSQFIDPDFIDGLKEDDQTVKRNLLRMRLEQAGAEFSVDERTAALDVTGYDVYRAFSKLVQGE